MKIISWNLRYSSKQSSFSRVDALRKLDWDLIALQEVSRNAWKVFVESGIFDEGYFPLESFGLRPPDYRVHGAAIIARNGYKISNPQLIPNIPKVERAIAARVMNDGKEFTLVSWHAPNASSEGVAVKMKGYQGITNYIGGLDGPIILGFDGNHWNKRIELDPPDPTSEDDAFFTENVFYSNQPPHTLKDTYLTHLRNNKDQYQAIIQQRPDGPLAVSYVRKGISKTPIEDRFDYIFATCDFIVNECKYLYDEGVASGSDHAIVLADLDWN